MKFGQNLHETNTGNRRKPQFAATYRDSKLEFKIFFIPEIVGHVAKHIFSFYKKACLTKMFSLCTVEFRQHQHKARPHTHRKSQGAKKNMEDAVRIF